MRRMPRPPLKRGAGPHGATATRGARQRDGTVVRASAVEPRSPEAVTVTAAPAGAVTMLSRRTVPWASAVSVTVDCWLLLWLLPPLDCRD